jgi:hypothetical protein
MNVTAYITVISAEGGGITTTEVPGAENILPILQEAVGGFIEIVPFWDQWTHEGNTVPCIVYCNEEGKIRKLPVNEEATKQWAHAVKATLPDMIGRVLPDILVGDVVICHGDETFMREM